MVETLLNDKYKLILPEHRAAREQWHTPEGWERKRLDSMYENIGEGDVVYYVGSEEGEFPALCQIWGAEVVLFEPNPKVWSNTSAIWEANGLKHPLATFIGFASDVDDLSPHVPTKENPYNDFGLWPSATSKDIEAAHGFKELDKEAANYAQVRIDTISAKTKPPTAICLDVEGSEGHVLRGAEETLKTFKPKIWLSLHPEFLHEQYGEWGAELRKWIIDLGYIETLLDYPLHEVHLLYEPSRS